MKNVTTKNSTRVREIIELREGNRKVFKMSDGSEQAVFYSNDVHLFNEKTKRFEDVDNTLKEQNDGKYLVSQRGNFKAKFNGEENNELFSVEKGVHKIRVCARQEKGIDDGKLSLKPKLHSKAQKIKQLDKIVFEKVLNGADYEYEVTANGVKENIIVKERASAYSFPFTVNCKNVRPELDEKTGNVLFLSTETGKEEFFIPAPFMVDANGITSSSVHFELKEDRDNAISLTVIADSKWINDKNRAFPVVIDPQIQLSGNTAMTTYSWDDGAMYSSPVHVIGGTVDMSTSFGRMYMSINMPTLPRNPRIKKAYLNFRQESSSIESQTPIRLGLYQVTDDITLDGGTPSDTGELIDYAIMKPYTDETEGVIEYKFDITSLVDGINKGETTASNLVLRPIDVTFGTNNNITLFGSGVGEQFGPKLIVEYESTYGVNTSYRTHTHELGRFGQGSIDLQCLNLMFESEDFAWGGNRMPVTIKHLYNSALSDYQYTANGNIMLETADFSQMKLGNGYKLSIMQSMVLSSDGKYVYIGENGSATYFAGGSLFGTDESGASYEIYKEVDGEATYDPVKRTLTQGDEKYLFDSLGRLIKITDAFDNSMEITYTDNRITAVTDGAGRSFTFEYNASGFLASITAPDNTCVLYLYEGDLLSNITYQDGRKAVISYSANKPSEVILQDADANNLYKVCYSFYEDRLISVSEFGVENGEFTEGMQSMYTYMPSAGKTIVDIIEYIPSDDPEPSIKYYWSVYTFDDDGNVISDYSYINETGMIDSEGKQNSINPYMGDSGTFISNIDNLLLNHKFNGLEHWTETAENGADFYSEVRSNEDATKFGYRYVFLENYLEDSVGKGIVQATGVLPIGDYTFSAYVKPVCDFLGTDTRGAYLRVIKTDGTVLAESEHLCDGAEDYIRLVAPFRLTQAQSVQVQIFLSGSGTAHINAPQLEKNQYANEYNMLENGSFDGGITGWDATPNVAYDSSDINSFNRVGSLKITGSLDSNYSASQLVDVKSDPYVRETFSLSGWAKGYGLPKNEREGLEPPTFRLRAIIRYDDTTELEEHIAEFSPCTEDWQYTSVEFAKSRCKIIEDMTVYIEYGHNFGTAYFDNIQLVRNGIETDLTGEDFYTEEEVSTETEESTDTTTSTETSEDTEFKEFIDDFGNTLTETTFTDGEFGTIYRSFGFNAAGDGMDNAGNDLIRETDARGNDTTYTVDETTSRNEEITDRCGNKTCYEYDAAGRTTKVISKKANGTVVSHVSYGYNAFDNLSEIVRGDGMKYLLNYNAYHNLESIGIERKTDGDLVKYTYKEYNGRLKEITYANGDKMCATYNTLGQMVAEKWYNSAEALTAHYKYIYDGKGNIVRSIDISTDPVDISTGKEYDYTYENGKLMRSTESVISLDDNEFVIAKTLVCSTLYSYDSEDTLTKKRVKFADGSERVTLFEQTENDSQVVKLKVDDKTITSHSKTDSFGRKVFDELQLGSGFVSRQFSYHAGEVTDKHTEKGMVKSSAVTQLVSQIILSDGRTLSYEYDNEERITRVTDSVDGITKYTYDALGQLSTEEHCPNGADEFVTVNSMTYDDYGNIRIKNGIQYGYDTIWRDKLTAVGNQSITYDAQGNPTSYLGHTLAWEKGRQLKSFDTISYTYNANGIRTSKTVDGVRHDFMLDGGKILSEIWGDYLLEALYDNEDSVCGIIYHGTPYYFLKNLQGDIIAITDQNGDTVARYTYDAWGVPTITFDSTECTVATVNPFRYRGYYYDTETGLYYLQSRYYNPTVGRFVNGDEGIVLLTTNHISLEKNLFAYCYNTVTNLSDITGYQPRWAQAISRYAKNTWAYKTFLQATQRGWFSDLFWYAGFFRTWDGVYHTRQDCWQRFFGYNDVYDWAFNLGTSMRKAKFPFYYNGKSYIFWAWKGDYLNLGAGAELGIYYGGGWHWFVDTRLALKMTLNLKYRGRTIITYYPGKVWWITGFNPYYQNVYAGQLTAIYTIDFSSNIGMYNAFYKRHRWTTGWSFNGRKHIATYRF